MHRRPRPRGSEDLDCWCWLKPKPQSYSDQVSYHIAKISPQYRKEWNRAMRVHLLLASGPLLWRLTGGKNPGILSSSACIKCSQVVPFSHLKKTSCSQSIICASAPCLNLPKGYKKRQWKGPTLLAIRKKLREDFCNRDGHLAKSYAWR